MSFGYVPDPRVLTVSSAEGPRSLPVHFHANGMNRQRHVGSADGEASRSPGSALRSPSYLGSPRNDGSATDRSFLARSGTLVNSQPASARASLLSTSDLRRTPQPQNLDNSWLSAGTRTSESSSRRPAQEPDENDGCTLKLIIHEPRNLRFDGATRGSGVFCTVSMAGDGTDTNSQEHPVTTFPSEPIMLFLTPASSWDQSIRIQFWTNHTDVAGPAEPAPDRTMVAETCIPLVKLLEYGVTSIPLWMPFWLGLFPAGDRAFKETTWEVGASQPSALFEEAIRLAENLQEQKVCVAVNAAKCAMHFPPSSSQLQKTIQSYNRQIEAYHRQAEDGRALGLGDRACLKHDVASSTDAEPEVPKAQVNAEIARSKQLEEQLRQTEQWTTKLTLEGKTLREEFAELQKEHRARSLEAVKLQDQMATVNEEAQAAEAQLSRAALVEEELERKAAACEALADRVSELERMLATRTQPLSEAPLPEQVAGLQKGLQDGSVQTEALSELAAQAQTPVASDEAQFETMHQLEKERKELEDVLTSQETATKALREELSEFQMSIVISEDGENRLRLAMAQRDLQFAKHQEEIEEMTADLEVSRSVAAKFADSVSEEAMYTTEVKQELADERGRRREIEARSFEEQEVASRQKAMLDRAQKELTEQAEKLVAKESATQELYRLLEQQRQSLDSRASSDSPAPTLVDELRSELRACSGRAEAAEINLKTESAECASLREALVVWDALGERMGSKYASSAQSEDLHEAPPKNGHVRGNHVLNNSGSESVKPLERLQSERTPTVKALLEEVQAAYQNQVRLLRQCAAAPAASPQLRARLNERPPMASPNPAGWIGDVQRRATSPPGIQGGAACSSNGFHDGAFKIPKSGSYADLQKEVTELRQEVRELRGATVQAEREVVRRQQAGSCGPLSAGAPPPPVASRSPGIQQSQIRMPPGAGAHRQALPAEAGLRRAPGEAGSIPSSSFDSDDWRSSLGACAHASSPLGAGEQSPSILGCHRPLRATQPASPELKAEDRHLMRAQGKASPQGQPRQVPKAASGRVVPRQPPQGFGAASTGPAVNKGSVPWRLTAQQVSASVTAGGGGGSVRAGPPAAMNSARDHAPGSGSYRERFDGVATDNRGRGIGARSHHGPVAPPESRHTSPETVSSLSVSTREARPSGQEAAGRGLTLKEELLQQQLETKRRQAQVKDEKIAFLEKVVNEQRQMQTGSCGADHMAPPRHRPTNSLPSPYG